VGAEAPDLILLDVMLPKLDGYQVAAKIRSEEGSASHVPIIMLTAEREVEQKVRGLRAEPTITSSSRSTRRSCWPGSRACSRGSRHASRCSPGRRSGASSPSTAPRAAWGTTTIAINAAIALHRELGRKVALVDGNLQFGDHRVFLDLGLDRRASSTS
jgi:DNA-binding NarL/FixJ family response regulator